jgi:hypothetical protein
MAINQQTGRHNRRLLPVIIILALLIALMIYGALPVPTTQPVYRLPEATMESRTGVPLEGASQLHEPSLAVAAVDDRGYWYLLTKRKSMSTPHGVLHLMTLDADGRFKGITPLRRLDGRPIGHYCDFFSVSPSGERRWTARVAFDDERRDALLTVYNADNIPMQEWRLPWGWSGIGLLQAIDEKRADLFATNGELYRFTVGNTSPQRIASSLSIVQYIAPGGDTWGIRPLSASAQQAEYGLFKSGTDHQERLLTRINGFTITQRLSPFWHHPTRGLFCSMEQPAQLDDSSPYRHKVVYRVAAAGTVQELFSTREMLPRVPGRQVKVGQMLRADSSDTVWFAVEYSGGKRGREFQIVKTIRLPRWKIWWHRLSRP